MSTDKVVLTIAIGDDYQKIASYTHPLLERYAYRIGAGFLCLDNPSVSDTSAHWNKFILHDILKFYDRAIYFDTDLIIRGDTPDLFKIVPETHLGLFNEAGYTDRPESLIRDMASEYGLEMPQWDGRYYNTGVMVVSKQHQLLFEKPIKEINNFWEQTYLNMMIARLQVPVFDIGYTFNRMSCMDGIVCADLYSSFVIHYAGWDYASLAHGKEKALEGVIGQIQTDLKHFENHGQ